MSVILSVSNRGTVTLPPALRRRLGLDRLKNPMLRVEEENGRLFLEPVIAVPVRNIPESEIERWIAEDEAAMKKLSE